MPIIKKKKKNYRRLILKYLSIFIVLKLLWAQTDPVSLLTTNLNVLLETLSHFVLEGMFLSFHLLNFRCKIYDIVTKNRIIRTVLLCRGFDYLKIKLGVTVKNLNDCREFRRRGIYV